MTTNGRIPDDKLAAVAVGERLLTGAATAFRALVSQATHEHVSIKLAPGVGSAYRDLELQATYWKAAHGDEAAAKRVGLSTSSTVSVAAPGGSSHGWGDRVDLLFDGSDRPTVVHLNLCKRFGFTREFGSADANHFQHDGRTAIHPPDVAVSYTVQEGDTLTRIAARHARPGEDADDALERIERLNPQITNPDLIHVGQKVRVQ